MNNFLRTKTAAFTLALACTAPLSQASMMDQFLDEKDGMFDMSKFVLDNAHGFMPLPIVITEPALGSFGLGAALAFFHEDKEQQERRQSGEIESPELPPSVSGVAAAYTANDSWLAGGFHQGSYKEDAIRYTGALGYARVNLRFFGLNDKDTGVKDNGEQYEITGTFFMQDVRFRIAESNWFIGGEYTYLKSDTKFKNTAVPGLEGQKLDASTAGAGLIIFYDSRDNYFTPVSGVDGKLVYTLYREGLGGDFDFDKLKANTHAFWMLTDTVQLAVRGDVKAITKGDAPFWEVPFIQLRGIPMMRYQGEKTALAELEARWDFTPRWSINGFLGAGRAGEDWSDLGDATTRVTKGIGFRYLIMRLLKSRVGIDVAQGPEGSAFYITFGSAWATD